MTQGPVEPENHRATRKRLERLKGEHRALDEHIVALESSADADQLGIRRLKKRKLQLRDEMERLRSLLIPDLNA